MKEKIIISGLEIGGGPRANDPPKAPSGTLNSAKSRVLVPGLTTKKKKKKNL